MRNYRWVVRTKIGSKLREVRYGINTVTFALTQGKFTTIDREDWPMVKQYTWYAHKHRHTHYARTNVRDSGGERHNIRLHRLLLDNPDSGIDHKDMDGLNNRRLNLRLATNAENSRNRRAYGAILFKGVAWHKASKKYQASIRIDGKLKYLGVFGTTAEAAKAYDKAAIELFGEFARINFPDSTRTL